MWLLNNELFKSVQFSEQGHIVDLEFQDDNLCPVHWARTVLYWFAEHETEVPHIIWLTNLLDVNVIEKNLAHVWMGHREEKTTPYKFGWIKGSFDYEVA